MTILKDMRTPVFKEEGMPSIDPGRHSVSFEGHSEKKLILTMEDILNLPQSTLDCRMTSVSGFSVRANWQGVLWKDIIERIGPVKKFDYVMFESVGGYTTNAYAKDILPDRWMFCHSVNGESLEAEYGGPLRMIIPNLWGYKSCKWLSKVFFSEKNIPGFWETHGYSDRGLIEPGTTLDINTGERKDIRGGEVLDF